MVELVNPVPIPRVSIVVPVKNERDNIAPLMGEIAAAFSDFGAYEIIYVDDGSNDGTAQMLERQQMMHPQLRVLRHAQSCGKSGGLRSGIYAARSPLIATLDGDGQNDPAFLPAMIAAIEAAGPEFGIVQGERERRRDTPFKRVQSRIANGVRGSILSDGTRDTGCGITVVRRDAYMKLPYFAGLHRFMPALIKREGYAILVHPVKDRPRLSGHSHYGFFNRFWVGLVDLIGVWWLIKRNGVRQRALEKTS